MTDAEVVLAHLEADLIEVTAYPCSECRVLTSTTELDRNRNCRCDDCARRWTA